MLRSLLVEKDSAPLARDINSDAKDRASNGIGLDGTTAQSFCGIAIAATAALAREGHQQSARVRSRHPADRGKQWRTIRRPPGAARMRIGAGILDGANVTKKDANRECKLGQQEWLCRLEECAFARPGRHKAAPLPEPPEHSSSRAKPAQPRRSIS